MKIPLLSSILNRDKPTDIEHLKYLSDYLLEKQNLDKLSLSNNFYRELWNYRIFTSKII